MMRGWNKAEATGQLRNQIEKTFPGRAGGSGCRGECWGHPGIIGAAFAAHLCWSAPLDSPGEEVSVCSVLLRFTLKRCVGWVSSYRVSCTPIISEKCGLGNGMTLGHKHAFGRGHGSIAPCPPGSPPAGHLTLQLLRRLAASGGPCSSFTAGRLIPVRYSRWQQLSRSERGLRNEERGC